MGTVDIIMPVYNGEKYLKETIKSVIIEEKNKFVKYYLAIGVVV